ncbi:hypothetical protein [Flavobacterium sp.]|uniref:hypothetical protein n=1 Tax=Flavobacterium sp. TaxID=239 RepID=UPI00286C6EED|nr:hypothetical protein [Flavobacterium sp.]
MKKRLQFIILLLGIFLLPSLSYACGTKIEKSCCKKEISSKTEKKDCCKNEQSNEQDNSCGGKCGHSNCTSSPFVNLSIIECYQIEFKDNDFYFSIEKPKFYHSKTFISSAFSSVWLPPKIK